MTDLNNLDLLTDKVYQEGIARVEKETGLLRTQAEQERREMLESAKAEADQLVSQAKREAERLRRSVEKELQLKGKQFISDLQQEVHDLLKEKIITQSVQGAFADQKFLQEVIQEAVKGWNEQENLEMIFPKALENKLKSAFVNSIEQQIPDLKLTFSDQISGGFRIGTQDESYQVSFTEADFIHLFEPYLTQQTSKLLFAGA